jgi:hypothetical protein
MPYENIVAVNTGDINDLGKISFVGSVKLDSNPTGADVYVEGELKGKTPITIKELKARQTRIELKYPGRPSTVELKPRGRPRTVEEALARLNEETIGFKHPGERFHSTTVAVKPDTLTDLGVLKLSPE